MTAEDINIGWGAILETFEMRSVGFGVSNTFLDTKLDTASLPLSTSRHLVTSHIGHSLMMPSGRPVSDHLPMQWTFVKPSASCTPA